MRICHFTSTFFPRVGGVEIVVSNLARSQHESGHSVIVITPRIRGINNKVTVPYRVVHYSRPSSKRYLTRQVLLRLLWEHWRDPFDILHCHSAYPHGYVASSFSRLTGVPVVVTPHGPTDIMREEQIRRNPILEKRMARGMRSAAGITAISNHIFDEILSIGGIASDKVHTIPNGVNLDDFTHVEKISLEFPYVFAMGRMVHQKGFDHLLRAFQGVIHATQDLHLLIAGEGVHRRDYEMLAASLGLEGRVQFLGLVQGTQKIGFMKGAEFFICPSRFEPFGIVVLEAMASGIPVVANRVGGIVDIIEEGKQGLFAEPSSVESLRDAILSLHRNPQLRNQMAEQALARSKDYDWSIINQRYVDVYLKGIQNNTRKPPWIFSKLFGNRTDRSAVSIGS
ncbi:glycosyltransferase family 4 protein [bacterium]|nr:glycosyltransferase family 4 protein [bacterium]